MEPGSPQILELNSGTLIADRYEVCERVGVGGMGAVYRVVDKTLDYTEVALKLLYPHLVKDEVVFARFRNEVLVARRLAHPDIIQIYDFGAAGGGHYYISMEFVSGGCLGERIYGPRHERPTMPEAISFLHRVARALEHAHKKGVIHRDLKPDNILLPAEGGIRITDFGLARMEYLDKGFTATGEAVGTPYYMSPEQVRGDKHVDGRADIYSIGIMAYELVVGQRPFDADSWFNLAQKHLQEELPEFASKDHGIPKWFEDFARRCAAKSPDDRYTNMSEVAEILEEFTKEDLTQTKKVPAVFNLYTKKRKSLSHRQRKVRRIKITAAAAIVCGVVFGMLQVSSTARNVVGAKLLQVENAVGMDFAGLKDMVGTTAKLDSAEFLTRIQAGDHQAVKLLLNAGMDPNTKDPGGNTMLSHAIHNGNTEVAFALLSGGADPNLTDGDDTSALMHAARQKNTYLVNELIERGAHVNARNEAGRSAIVFAIENNDLGTLRSLVDQGAQINVRDKEGKTALLHAVQNAERPVVQALIDEGAKVDARSAIGVTPLMIAAERGNKEFVDLLLLAGANPAIRNNAGLSAYDMAQVVVKARIRDAMQFADASAGEPATKTHEQPKVITIRGGSSSAAGAKAESSESQPVQPRVKKTRLRVKGRPAWELEYGRGTKVKRIYCKVRNQRNVTANDVSVYGIIPGGKRFKLNGPTTVGPNETVDFSVDLKEYITRDGKPKVEISCSNCYR